MGGEAPEVCSSCPTPTPAHLPTCTHAPERGLGRPGLGMESGQGSGRGCGAPPPACGTASGHPVPGICPFSHSTWGSCRACDTSQGDGKCVCGCVGVCACGCVREMCVRMCVGGDGGMRHRAQPCWGPPQEREKGRHKWGLGLGSDRELALPVPILYSDPQTEGSGNSPPPSPAGTVCLGLPACPQRGCRTGARARALTPAHPSPWLPEKGDGANLTCIFSIMSNRSVLCNRDGGGQVSPQVAQPTLLSPRGVSTHLCPPGSPNPD